MLTMKNMCAVIAVLVLTACGQPSSSVVLSEQNIGSITKVSANPSWHGLMIQTSAGFVVFADSYLPLQVGEAALLRTESYKSGMVVRRLCTEAIGCVPLLGTQF